MDTNFTVPRHELLQVADAVAREKSIERDEVLEAMEQAIQKAGRAKYGHEHDIRATIDRKTGEIRLARYRQVADPIENEFTQITPKYAADRDPSLKLGDFLIDELPPIDFGRIAAQTAKQVIVQKVREAERRRQFEEFKDRKGDIVNGLVKRVEFGNVTVDLGRGESILRPDEPAPAIRGAGPRSPSSRTTAPSIPWAPAWVCAAVACRRWWANSRVKRSTSFPGPTTRRHSWSMRWPRRKSPR